MSQTNQDEITLAISGASGAPYALKLLAQLLKAKVKVHLVVSDAGRMVFQLEEKLQLPAKPESIKSKLLEHLHMSEFAEQLTVYSKDNWLSPLASGSGAPKKMIVCPCTTGCLAAIATGMSDNLLERAADVVIKEQGKLVLVVREAPLSAIHLGHMHELAKIGVCIMPANPGFYHEPESVADLVDFMVARMLDQLGVEHELMAKWGVK